MLRVVDDLTGQILGRNYRVVRLLEVGEISTLYAAETADYARPFTLEMFHSELIGREECRLFIGAAMSAAEVSHPHIVSLIDFTKVDEMDDGDDGDTPLVVWEELDGESLARVLQRLGRIMPQRAARIAIQTLSALEAAHVKHIVHGAITPATLFLVELIAVEGDVVKVCGFGSARVIAALDAKRGPPVSARARFLSPPEGRDGGELEARSDLYAVAATIYLAVSGLREVELAALETVPPLASLGLDIDDELSAIVARGLSADPADRHASARDMEIAFRRWLGIGLTDDDDERTPDAVIAKRRETTLEIARGGSGTPASRSELRRSWRHPIVAATAALVLACAGWTGARRGSPSRTTIASPALSESGSTNAEAIAAYRAGVDAIRNAAGGTARRNFDRAVTLDPAFAAAHLRKVLATPWVGDAEREDVRQATLHRGTLTEHDRALLHAIEPWVAVPQDAREVTRRLAELAASREDPELHYQLCRFLILDGNYGHAAAACRAARELDPSFAGAFWLEGQSELALGDTLMGMESLQMCLRVAPVATSCINDVLQIEMNEGQCEAAAHDAQRLAAIAPEAASMEDLGIAFFASGKSIAATRATYERAADLLSGEGARVKRASLEEKMSSVSGDFIGALAHLDEWDKAVAASTDEEPRVAPFLRRTWLLRELGRDAEVVALSRAALAARAGLAQTSELDLEIAADVALYRAGAMTRDEFVGARGAWIAIASHRPWVSGSTGFAPIRRWIASYAESVKSTEDASDALAALPQYLPLPPDRFRWPDDDEPLGRTYLLAGRVAEAVPFLRRAATSCRAANDPFHHTWGNVELGMALESIDVRGACDAYRVALDRWGMVAESRSAAVARARRSALGCK